jgi:hypothetical protein
MVKSAFNLIRFPVYPLYKGCQAMTSDLLQKSKRYPAHFFP